MECQWPGIHSLQSSEKGTGQRWRRVSRVSSHMSLDLWEIPSQHVFSLDLGLPFRKMKYSKQKLKTTSQITPAYGVLSVPQTLMNCLHNNSTKKFLILQMRN
jgi:hypothetical protein